MLGEALGELYVAKYFSSESKARALDVVERVRTALRERLGVCVCERQRKRERESGWGERENVCVCSFVCTAVALEVLELSYPRIQSYE